MREILVAGAMAVAMLAQGTGQQQQTIPDAPKPQSPALAGVGPVAPGKGTTASSNGDAPGAMGADAETAPGTVLPGSPAAVAAEAEADTGPAPTSSAADLPTLVLRANFVDVPFTVKDSKNRLVPGLNYHEIRVYENGLAQHMSVFSVDPVPLSVALVIDQSMDVHTMERVNSSLAALQGAFTAYDEVALFTYNNGPKKISDFTGGQSTRLMAAVDQSKAGGREQMYYAPGEGLGGGINLNGGQQEHVNPLTTGHGVSSPQGVAQVQREVHTLNDAILEAAKVCTKAGPGRRRVIYVISDGKEYGSVAKTKDVVKYLEQNKIQVFATLVGDSSIDGLGFVDTLHLPFTMRDNLLPVYTKATGGEYFAAYRQKAIETSFAKITEDVRTQYTVGYYSREPVIDGKFRKLEVRVLRPNLTVNAKAGYYPAAQAVPPPAVSDNTRPATP